MTFDPVTEDFVEEDAGGAAREDGGAGVRLCGGCFEKSFDMVTDDLDGGADFIGGGQAVGRERFKSLEIGHIHTIFRLGAGGDNDTGVATAIVYFGAISIDDVTVINLRADLH